MYAPHQIRVSQREDAEQFAPPGWVAFVLADFRNPSRYLATARQGARPGIGRCTRRDAEQFAPRQGGLLSSWRTFATRHDTWQGQAGCTAWNRPMHQERCGAVRSAPGWVAFVLADFRNPSGLADPGGIANPFLSVLASQEKGATSCER